MTTFHLAQLNVARVLAPLDSPAMADFVAQLDAVNALADGAPGFVWRLQTEDGDATAVRAFDDAAIIVNMSVWESPEALHAYVYEGGHLDVLRRRREWFARMAEAFTVLWWVPAGQRPTVPEGVGRLEHLRREGPTPHAFSFRTLFAPPGAPGLPSDARGASDALRDACPVG